MLIVPLAIRASYHTRIGIGTVFIPLIRRTKHFTSPQGATTTQLMIPVISHWHRATMYGPFLLTKVPREVVFPRPYLDCSGNSFAARAQRKWPFQAKEGMTLVVRYEYLCGLKYLDSLGVNLDNLKAWKRLLRPKIYEDIMCRKL
jgi:hypothetical protein